MRKINIYLVESPFQLLSAIEAKECYKNFDSMIIIKNVADRKSNELMEKMLALSKWDKTIKIDYHAPTVMDLQFLNQIKKLKKIEKDINAVFIGFPQTRAFQWFCEKLSVNNCFILDDGTHTIELQKKFFSQGNYLQGSDILSKAEKSFLKRGKNLLKLFTIRHFFGLKESKNFSYNLFTCYNLKANPQQSVVLHNFEHIKSKISSCKRLEDRVYFYGSPLSEIGIVKHDSEIKMLKKINNFFLKKDKNLFYIPHRGDSEEKIFSIQKLGIEIKTIDIIAEVEPIISKTVPSEIASFYSTALFTLNKIYDYDFVTAFKIPQDEIMREDKKDGIKEIYKEYAKHMQIVDLTKMTLAEVI